MKVSALKARTLTVPVVVPGSDGEPDETVQLTYRPGSLTMELWEDLKVISEDPSGADIQAIRVFLMSDEDPLIVGWDLEEEDGSAYPCDGEHLSKLPLDFLGMMVDAIGSSALPNQSRGGTLGDGSLLKAVPDPAPGGTESSEQQIASDVNPGS